MDKAKYIYYSYQNNSFSILWLYSDGKLSYAKFKENSGFYVSEEKCKEKDLFNVYRKGYYEINENKLSIRISEISELDNDTSIESLLRRAVSYLDYSRYITGFAEKLLFKSSALYVGPLDDTIFYLYWNSDIKFSLNEEVEFVKPTRFTNQDEIYPIILLPIGIHSAIYNEVTDEEAIEALNIEPPELIQHPLPEKPKKYIYVKRRANKKLLILEIVSLALIILGFLEALNNKGSISFFVILFTITFIFFLFSYKNKKQINVEKKLSDEEYNKLLQEHENKCDSIRSENKKLKQAFPEKYNEFKSRYGKDIAKKKSKMYAAPGIKKSGLTVGQNRSPNKRGRTELAFLQELYQRFGSNVIVDAFLGETSYQPDFIITLNRLGLKINVEIDEPYTNSIDDWGNTEKGKPIHFINGPDDDRNDYFLNKGWIIIRFSEKQIIEETTYCADLVQNVYEAIDCKSSTYGLTVKKDKRWTYEEARLMYYNKERSKWSNLEN